MTAPVRTPGRPGKRPPKRAPSLKFARLRTGTIPAHPAAEDYLAALDGGWQMLGNDRAGDCVAVTYANVRRLVTTTLTGNGYYPTQDEVWAVYKTQNPDFDPNGDPAVNGPGSPADGGMDVQTLLELLVKEGGPDDVKAVAFAAVDYTNPDEVKAAIAVFGYVWTGTGVLACNQQQFGAGQPWDYDPASPLEGGHSVITAGYGPPGPGPLGGDERFITWAAETSFTDAFWANEIDECWAVLWPEHLGSKAFLEGVDQAQLAADYEAITGSPFPVPTPVPAPPAPPAPAPGCTPGVFEKESPMSDPTPEPAPVPESAGGVIAHIRQWFEKDIVPEVDAVKADLEKLLKFAEAYAPNASAVANLLVQVLKEIDPAVAPGAAALIAEAEKVAVEAARIAEELLGKM